MSDPTVAIFRTGLLPSTQTFIPNQVNALTRFTPLYVGLERIANGLTLSPDPIALIERHSFFERLHKLAYKGVGVAPGFHRRVAAHKPQLIHAHFILDGIYALWLAKKLDRPLVVTLHGPIPTSFGRALPPSSIDHMLYTRRLPELWDKAAIFLCVSDFIRQRALALGYPEGKLRVHYIGVDLSRFPPSIEPRDPHLVLFVGRLSPRKGCAYLIEAMAQVQHKIPQAKLVIIGTGPELRSLESLSQRLNVDAQFLGELPSTDVSRWLLRARVFAGPSLTSDDGDAEALGMVFAEAQATGLPVASFRHGGIPEVVLDERTGLLADERDTDKLAHNILRLLEDEALWTEYSEEAIRWVHQRFDLVTQTQELEQHYSSLLP